MGSEMCIRDRSILPSVLIDNEVRTNANRVALKLTDPSEFSGIFIDTKRCKVEMMIYYYQLYYNCLPDPAGGKTASRTFCGVRFQIFWTITFSSRLHVSMQAPSIFIRSDVRITAKSVAVNVTVPSGFNGIFIATNF